MTNSEKIQMEMTAELIRCMKSLKESVDQNTAITRLVALNEARRRTADGHLAGIREALGDLCEDGVTPNELIEAVRSAAATAKSKTTRQDGSF